MGNKAAPHTVQYSTVLPVLNARKLKNTDTSSLIVLFLASPLKEPVRSNRSFLCGYLQYLLCCYSKSPGLWITNVRKQHLFVLELGVRIVTIPRIH